MTINPDSIPRYEQPMDTHRPDRSCSNCGHGFDMSIGFLCCCERDKIGRLGEVYVIEDPEGNEACMDWEAL